MVAARKENVMHLMLAQMFPMAAAGIAFLVWLFGGGFGLALVVFVFLKLLGK
jgi:hypothetical protein